MEINLHPGQSEVLEDLFVYNKIRNAVVCCSRGWGKSYLAGAAATTAVTECQAMHWSVPNKNVAIIAPTYDQVVDIYYPMLAYDFGLEQFAIKSSRDSGRFLFPNNVELRLLSYEAVERMRGKGFYFVVWDEPSSCVKGITPKAAWEGIIQPCIVTRWSPQRAKIFGTNPGRSLTIGTPKGYNYFYEMFYFSEEDDLWGSYQYDYTESPLLDANEIERIKDTVDPIEFASEYLASFTESGNSVFYCFDRSVHVVDDIPYFDPPDDKGNRGEDVHVFIDFNVGLQCSSFWALRGGQLHCLDEVKGHPDTESLAISIAEKFEGHRIFAYPDPSGRARKTSAPVGRTDFSIIESYKIVTRARPKAPPIVDSVNAVNKKLMTAAGSVDMYIHPRCTGVINSLERTKWVDKNPDTATIDKTEGVEHYSDGIRYGTEFLFPVNSGTKSTSRGFRF